MKGIVFNVFEKFVTETFNEETWDECVEKANLEDEVFVSTKIYDDHKLLDIFGQVVKLKKLVASSALELFGEYLFNALGAKYPEVISSFDNPKDFLKGLDEIIHVEVKKMMSGATPPQFITKLDREDELHLVYRSERKMCALAKGLMNGLNKMYDNSMEIKHTKCEHNGDSECLFEFKFFKKL